MDDEDRNRDESGVGEGRKSWLCLGLSADNCSLRFRASLLDGGLRIGRMSGSKILNLSTSSNITLIGDQDTRTSVRDPALFSALCQQKELHVVGLLYIHRGEVDERWRTIGGDPGLRWNTRSG